ncbi:MAG: MFS transporter, partial [Longimicrobiales bacterium]
MLLLVEFFDELVFGAWTAAWPLIRSDLGLSYVEVGLLFALPHVFASILEPPLGLLGDAWDRRALVRTGGLAFIGGLLLMAASNGFAPLLFALMLIFPASGAFVSLSQATLMDADPDPRRHELNMAWWTLAGSVGVVAGPIVLAAVMAAGFGWRATFICISAVGAVSLALAWRIPMQRPAAADGSVVSALGEAGRAALRALRGRDVLRWLTLLQFADLLLDVLLGFLALYFVDVMGATGARAAFAIFVYTGIGLLGDALLIPLLGRMEGARYLRASAYAMLLAFPAFLLLRDSTMKLVLLAAVALLNSGWYSILKARLYSAMPDRTATVM